MGACVRACVRACVVGGWERVSVSPMGWLGKCSSREHRFEESGIGMRGSCAMF